MASSQADPGDNDVLCGRGAQTNTHTGNIRFRQLVVEHQPEYVMAKKDEKEGIARKIILAIHGRGGKFLGKNPEGEWVEVDEKKSLLKTSQALREGMQVRAKTTSPQVKQKKEIVKDTDAEADAKPAAEVPIAPRPPPPPAKILTSKSVSSSSLMSGNDMLSDNDVLCGRGGMTNAYVGNIKFRKIVTEHQPRYLVCKRAEKEQIAQEILRIVHERGGRFVTKNAHGGWEEIEEKKAILKCSQALREGMNVRGGTLKSPERSSKFAAALKDTKPASTKQPKKQAAPKMEPVSADVYEVIAKLPTIPRPQLETLARALLSTATPDTVAVAVKAMNNDLAVSGSAAV